MRKIVIAPRNIHFQILNTYRKQDPFCDIKIYTLKELEREILPSFSIDSLLYLLGNKKYSYEVGKMYLEVLPYIKSDTGSFKIDELNNLKEELGKNSPVNYPKPSEDLLNQEVDVVGYSESNNELMDAIKKLNLKPTFILNSGDIKNKEVLIFSKIEEEVYHVLNHIAELLDNNIDIKDIYILRRNNEYDYYLEKFAPTFGYQVNIDKRVSYYSTGAFKEFKKIYLDTKDINLSLEKLKEVMKEDEMYEEIKLRILDNFIEDLDFATQYDYLCGRLKESFIVPTRYDKAVEVINYSPKLENKYVFVMGFAQGQFPSKVKSNSLLDNSLLEKVGMITTKNKIKEDEEIFIDFMKSNNKVFYSFSEKSNSSGFYLSPIAKKMKMETNKPTISKYFYSQKVLKYIFTDLLDNKRLYKETPEIYSKILGVVDVDYITYDNQISDPPKIYDENSKLKLSYTKLDKYYGCPFEYYIDHCVGLDNFENNFYTILGSIAHHMIEVKDNIGYDFEKEFEDQINEYSLKYEFDSREAFLLRGVIKKQIENAVDAIKLRESYYNKKKDLEHGIFITTDVTVYPEEKIYIKLDDNTIVEGIIDNLTVIDDKYFVCIDYKTNATKFDPKELSRGHSTQLPTYIYLVSQNDKFSHLVPAGVYINNLLTSKAYPEKEEDLHIYKHLKLNGKTLNDLDFIYAFDQSFAQGGISFISSLSRKKEDIAGSTLIGKETFEEYEDIVRQLFIDMAVSLRENKFDIFPRVLKNGHSECDYCPYIDICYRRKDQFNLPPKAEEEAEVEE